MKDRDEETGKFLEGNNAANVGPIDWTTVDKLALVHCTGQEVADFLGVGLRTLDRRSNEDHGMPFGAYLTQKRNVGRISLRRRQWMSAIGEKAIRTKTTHRGDTTTVEEYEEYILAPSVTMQIWLGKNQLGQTDKVEVSGEIRQKVFRMTDAKPPDDGLEDE